MILLYMILIVYGGLKPGVSVSFPNLCMSHSTYNMPNEFKHPINVMLEFPNGEKQGKAYITNVCHSPYKQKSF